MGETSVGERAHSKIKLRGWGFASLKGIQGRDFKIQGRILGLGGGKMGTQRCKIRMLGHETSYCDKIPSSPQPLPACSFITWIERENLGPGSNTSSIWGWHIPSELPRTMTYDFINRLKYPFKSTQQNFLDLTKGKKNQTLFTQLVPLTIGHGVLFFPN